jgi:hypothetical protein
MGTIMPVHSVPKQEANVAISLPARYYLWNRTNGQQWNGRCMPCKWVMKTVTFLTASVMDFTSILILAGLGCS